MCLQEARISSPKKQINLLLLASPETDFETKFAFKPARIDGLKWGTDFPRLRRSNLELPSEFQLKLQLMLIKLMTLLMSH